MYLDIVKECCDLAIKVQAGKLINQSMYEYDIELNIPKLDQIYYHLIEMHNQKTFDIFDIDLIDYIYNMYNYDEYI